MGINMKQSEQDAIIMQQMWEKIIGVLYENNVMYSRKNIERMAQILMAVSVNMMAMSSNNVVEFRQKSQKMINDMVTVLETMDPKRRSKLMSAIDHQLEWFKDSYKKQQEEFEKQEEKTDEEKNDFN